MVRLRPEWLAVVALLSASALTGCATGRGSRQAAAGGESAVVVTQAAPGDRLGEVRPVAFEEEGAGSRRWNESVRTAELSAADDSRPLSQADTQRPAEVVVAPDPDALDSGRRSMPLDLPTALGMTQGQNPRVAFAQAQIAQSLAVHDAARALWLPSIRAGGNYNKHEGRIQRVEGQNIDVSRGAAFGGFGANAVGAGSPGVPGIYAYFQTTDAIFQRRITGYALEAREFQASA